MSRDKVVRNRHRDRKEEQDTESSAMFGCICDSKHMRIWATLEEWIKRKGHWYKEEKEY